KKQRATSGERVSHAFARRRKFDCRSCRRQTKPVFEIFALIKSDWTCAQWRGRARVWMLWRTQTRPTDAAGKAKSIEPFRIVVGDTRAEHSGFPRRERQLAAVKLFEDRLQSFRTFDPMFGIDALPRKKKSIKILSRNRLNFRAQPIDRQSMNSCKQSSVAPFLFRRVRMKFSAQNKSFTFKSEQSGFDFRSREAKNVLDLGFRDRPRNFHSTAKQFANRVGSFPI